jgi:hypothetical protein
LTTSSGELGGELLALQLNLDLADAGFITNAVPFGSLFFCNFIAVPQLNGTTVDDFVADANWLLGGGGGTLSPATTSAVARALNNAFVDGTPSTFAQTNLVAGPGCGWKTGEMVTASQSDWGDSLTSVGALLNASFDSVYPTDLVVGDTNLLRFTDAGAVFTYLPTGGGAGVLTSTIVNPLTTSAGELGGEVTALKLNTDYSAQLGNAISLASLRICGTSLPSMNGQTVTEFQSVANHILGGGSAPITPTQAAALARFINNAFVSGSPSTFAQENLVAGNCPP